MCTDLRTKSYSVFGVLSVKALCYIRYIGERILVIFSGKILSASERNEIEEEMGRFKGYKNNLKNGILYDHLTYSIIGSPISHCLFILCLNSTCIFKGTCWGFFNGLLKLRYDSVLPCFSLRINLAYIDIKVKYTWISRCLFPGFSQLLSCPGNFYFLLIIPQAWEAGKFSGDVHDLRHYDNGSESAL